MNSENLLHIIQTLNDPGSAPQQKQLASNHLRDFEADPENWMVGFQLINRTEPEALFFAYKYIHLILIKRPDMLTQEQISHLQGIIAQKLVQPTGPGFVGAKLVQVALQLIFNKWIAPSQMVSYCCGALKDENCPEEIAVILLQVISRLFGQASSEKLEHPRVTFSLIGEMRADLSQLSSESLLECLSIVIRRGGYGSTCGALETLKQVASFGSAVQIFQYLLRYASASDFKTVAAVTPENVNVMGLVMAAVGNCFQQIAKIQGASFQKETYEGVMVFLYQASLCATHQTESYSYAFLYEYIQLFRTLVTPALFDILFSAQKAQMGKTLSNPVLLCPKTLQVVDEMVQFKLQSQQSLQTHFLSLLVYAFRLMASFLQFEELQQPIIECCQEVLDQERPPSQQQIFKQILYKELETIVRTVMGQIQRPQDLMYFVDDFGQLQCQKIEDSSQIALYEAQIKLIRTIVSQNKQLQEVFRQEMAQLLRQFSPERLMKITFAYEAFYRTDSNFSTQVIFMLLNLMSLQIDPQQQLLTTQAIFYVVQKSPLLLKDPALNLQILDRCFVSIANLGQFEDLVQQAVQCATACVQSAMPKALEAYKEHILSGVFGLAEQRLTSFQIQQLYAAFVDAFQGDLVSLSILVRPVQERFSELCTVWQHEVQKNPQSMQYAGGLNQLLSIFAAIAKQLKPGACQVFFTAETFMAMQALYNFYRETENLQLISILRYFFVVFAAAGPLDAGRELLQLEHANFINRAAQNVVRQSDFLYIKLLKKIQNPEYVAQAMSLLVQLQKQQQDISPEINELLYDILDMLLDNQAQLLIQFGSKQDFFRLLVEIAADMRFEPQRFDSFYSPHRETLSILVYRQVGGETLLGALRLLRQSEHRNFNMVLDILQIIRKSPQNREVPAALGVVPELLEAVVHKDPAAIEDLRVLLQ